MPNLALPTGGGNQLWADVAYDGGWRVQRHVWTGHARLLDRNDVRRAWGSEESCRAALAERAPGLENASLPVAVVLHGLWRSRDSMSAITEALEESGFEVLDVAYPSTRRTIAEHAAQVAELLDGLRGEGREVSFVTHSLGGLVTPRAPGARGRRVARPAPARPRGLHRRPSPRRCPGARRGEGAGGAHAVRRTQPGDGARRGGDAPDPAPPLPRRGRRARDGGWVEPSGAGRRRRRRRRRGDAPGRRDGAPRRARDAHVRHAGSRSSGPRWSSCSPTDEMLFLGGVKAPQPHGGSRLPRSRQSAAPRVHERAALARAR